MRLHTSELVRFVQREFSALADPEKAVPMAAYAQTTMPFYGTQQPDRRPVFREMKRRFPPFTRREYEARIRALWALPRREEKYAALEYACQHERYIAASSMRLYEQLIREGAWWDLVDTAAITLVGLVLLKERDAVRPVIEAWIDDPDLWIRRAALLSQNRHGQETDQKQLFDHCLQRAHEKEFFIRKAIGWALRQYSYTEPAAVRDFLLAHRRFLSGLSFREGARQLVRQGMFP